MKRLLTIFISLFAFVALFIGGIRLYQCIMQKAPKEYVAVFKSGDEGSQYYRIPALEVCLDGTIVALADRRGSSNGDLPNLIDIVSRRSTDGGKTWGPQIVLAQHTDRGFGDAAIVLDRNSGDLIVIFAGGLGIWQSTKDEHTDIYTCRSSDCGLSWSEPRCISDCIYSGTEYVAAFAASGSAVQFEDGTLAFVVAATDGGFPFCNHLCVSKDGGESWEMLPGTPGKCGDESKVAELPNGDLLMSIRNASERARRYSISKDRGMSWSPYEKWSDIPHSGCNGDMIRYRVAGCRPKDILLQSFPGDSLLRKDLRVALSVDEGKTWPISRAIFPEGTETGYSSLAILKNGMIGLLTEIGDGEEIDFCTFSLEWLDD